MNLGAGGEDAEGGIGDDLLDGLLGGDVLRLGVTAGGSGVAGGSGSGFGRAGQVHARDLEAVEEKTGAAGVDLVGGDAAEDLADGGLDGRAVLGDGQVKGGLAGAALLWGGDGPAGGVVVVAELFRAKAGAGAAVSVGEDVAALEAFGGFGHGGLPPPGGLCKVSEGKDIPVDFSGVSGWVNEKSPACAGL
jgi:hypothetical protein